MDMPKAACENDATDASAHDPAAPGAARRRDDGTLVPILRVIEWGPDLMVGVPVVDQDHEMLIALVNDLVHACERGASLPMRRRCIEVVIRFFADHQAREERQIRLRGGPGIDEHVRSHAEGSVYLDGLRREAEDDTRLAWAVLALRRWTLAHIVEHDLPLFRRAAASA